ncbi:nuclear transport factor 2 family protein [Methylobacterium sp. WL120]|nr:nuclear transport factor 2 family protein [Methylobacterium sp. WL120]
MGGSPPVRTFSPAIPADTLACDITTAKGCTVPDAITPATTDGPDHDRLLRANLERVFNERNGSMRARALDELYGADPVMYEPANVVRGRAAISEVAGKLLEQFGPDFRFVPDGAAVGHHGFGVLRWRAGPSGGPVVVTGSDVADVVDGRIERLWVMLDPQKT